MCGRFALKNPSKELKQYYNTKNAVEYPARYNIAPSQPVLTINNDPKGERVMDIMRWGLVPSWAKDMSIGNKMINARSETIEEKPSFRNAFKRRRCIIPASGFYEWHTKTREPYYISPKEDILSIIYAFSDIPNLLHERALALKILRHKLLQDTENKRRNEEKENISEDSGTKEHNITKSEIEELAQRPEMRFHAVEVWIICIGTFLSEWGKVMTDFILSNYSILLDFSGPTLGLIGTILLYCATPDLEKALDKVFVAENYDEKENKKGGKDLSS